MFGSQIDDTPRTSNHIKLQRSRQNPAAIVDGRFLNFIDIHTKS